MCTVGAQGAPQPGVCGQVHSTRRVRVHSPARLAGRLAGSLARPGGVDVSTLLTGWWFRQGARGWWRCGGGGRGGGGVNHPIKLGDDAPVPGRAPVLGCRGEIGNLLPPSSTWCRWGRWCRWGGGSRSRRVRGRRIHWCSGVRGWRWARGRPWWRWSRSRPPCLAAGRSLPIPLPLGRALVARAVGRRRRRGRREKREGRVRVAQVEVVANLHGATSGGEVQGGGAPHAPHRQELPQGGLEEVHSCS